MRRVAIYGRVSTEHEAQLSAFENQQAWYEREADRHSDWIIVDRYYDEGITGTNAEKRPEFMRMLADAQKHKFDLVVTREVCRFARNTVDTLAITRQLKDLNIEVYFISDGIWTMNNDSELRLSIMASLAQEESRKISERVRAGLKISREKGVLFGSGNILGYDRQGDTYVINAEQAFAVRKIFELYASGMGYKKICNELTCLGCKNASGNVKWNVDRIGRILRNTTYKGVLTYNQTHKSDFLSQHRIYSSESEYIQVKGKFEPIVSEELWEQCAEIRRKRCALMDKQYGDKLFGRKQPKTVWLDLLRCSCGSSFCSFLSYQNKKGEKTYGYNCYRRQRAASRQPLIEHGFEDEVECHQKSIPGWFLDLMARQVFSTVWDVQKEAVLVACQMIEECAAEEHHSYTNIITSLQDKIKKLHKRQTGLREMRSLGDITREEFQKDNQEILQEITALEKQISDLNSSKANTTPFNMKKIQKTLDQWIDLSGDTVPDSIIEQFILQVIVIDHDTFNWTLDLSSNNEPKMSAGDIARAFASERRNNVTESKISSHITDPQPIFELIVTEDDAREFCKRTGRRFFPKQWSDKRVIISV